MIVYAIHCGTTIKNLTPFGYFQRNAAGELMDAYVSSALQLADVGRYDCITRDKYCIHTYIRDERRAAIITDAEYPELAARAILRDLVGGTIVDEIYLSRAQDPAAVDKLTAVQQELDETTRILHKTMLQVIERGEQLDRLVEQSTQLSDASRSFYRVAKKTNSCCVIS